MGFLSNIWTTAATDWIFEPLAGEQVPGGVDHAPIQPETGYLSIFLRSMRIIDVRRGLTRFYPAAFSYISIPQLIEGRAEFQTVTSATKLEALDAGHVDRVISLNHRLLGPVPYRGGDLELEIGLFSIKGAELAVPFLKVLESMAMAAGVSFIATAKPFLSPLKNGLKLLADAAADSTLEVGLSTRFDNPETGYFVVMRAEKDAVQASELMIGEDHRLMKKDGQLIGNYPYMVLSIESGAERSDWFTIPDVSATYSELRDAVRSGGIGKTEEAFAMFRRTVLTSPDLLLKDAERLVGEVEGEINSVMQRGVLTRGRTTDLPELPSADLRELRSIDLFSAPGKSSVGP